MSMIPLLLCVLIHTLFALDAIVSSSCDNYGVINLSNDILGANYNTFEYTDNWQNEVTITIPNDLSSTTIRFVCTDVGAVGGFIANVKWNDIDYSTNPSSSYFTVISSSDNVLSPLVYTQKGSGQWGNNLNAPNIPNDAYWMWNSNVGNTMEFEFDFASINIPTFPPTNAPTLSPTNAPTLPPTNAPSIAPSIAPSVAPTKAPSIAPSVAPSVAPTYSPTNAPSMSPTNPTQSPSTAPTMYPSYSPTSAPTITWTMCATDIECKYIAKIEFIMKWSAIDGFGSLLSSLHSLEIDIKNTVQNELNEFIKIENMYTMVNPISSANADTEHSASVTTYVATNDRDIINALFTEINIETNMKSRITASLTETVQKRYENSSFNVDSIDGEITMIKPESLNDINSDNAYYAMNSKDYIILISVGTAVAVLLLILVICCIRCRYRRKRSQNEGTDVVYPGDIWRPKRNQMETEGCRSPKPYRKEKKVKKRVRSNIEMDSAMIPPPPPHQYIVAEYDVDDHENLDL